MWPHWINLPFLLSIILAPLLALLRKDSQTWAGTQAVSHLLITVALEKGETAQESAQKRAWCLQANRVEGTVPLSWKELRKAGRPGATVLLAETDNGAVWARSSGKEKYIKRINIPSPFRLCYSLDCVPPPWAGHRIFWAGESSFVLSSSTKRPPFTWSFKS